MTTLWTTVTLCLPCSSIFQAQPSRLGFIWVDESEPLFAHRPRAQTAADGEGWASRLGELG